MLVKLGMGGLDSRAVMGASLLVAAVLLAPFAAADTPTRSPTPGAWASVAALGLVCTAAAFVVYTVLIREAGTSRATVITYINPLVALVLGMTLVDERPGPGAFAGLVLILAGSWLSTGGGRPGKLRAATRAGSGRPQARPAAGYEGRHEHPHPGPVGPSKGPHTGC